MNPYILYLIYLVAGFSIFWPALTYYLKLWVHDFPWLFVVMGGIIVILTAISCLLGRPMPQLVSIFAENFQIKLIVTGIILLLFGGLNLRKDKSFLLPFILSWILIIIGEQLS